MKVKDFSTGVLDGDVVLSVWAKGSDCDRVFAQLYQLDADIPAFPEKYMECNVTGVFAIEHRKGIPCVKIEAEVEL